MFIDCRKEKIIIEKLLTEAWDERVVIEDFY